MMRKTRSVALLLACTAYMILVNGQITRNGTVQGCKKDKFEISGFEWIKLELPKLRDKCLKLNMTISDSVIGSVESNAFEKVIGQKFVFTKNRGSNNGNFRFNADFSKTPIIEFYIFDNTGLQLGEGVAFNKTANRIIMDKNGIKNIPVGFFNGLKELKRISLFDNRISCLDSAIFKGLDSLAYVNISQNNVSYLLENTFTHLTKLKQLDLSDNNLEMISADQFTFSGGNRRFPKIYVENNPLTKLPHCLAQLEVFNYTSNPTLTLTGQRQPNNTASNMICDGTDPYDYEASSCESRVPTTTTRVPTTTRYGSKISTTPSPDSKKPKTFDMRYLAFVFFLLGFPAIFLIVLLIRKCRGGGTGEEDDLEDGAEDLERKNSKPEGLRPFDRRNTEVSFGAIKTIQIEDHEAPKRSSTAVAPNKPAKQTGKAKKKSIKKVSGVEPSVKSKTSKGQRVKSAKNKGK